MVSKWSVITDHLETIYRPNSFGNWSVYGLQMVGKLIKKIFFLVAIRSVNGSNFFWLINFKKKNFGRFWSQFDR